MDYLELFKILKEDEKSLVSAAALCTPMAFADCWKLSATFRAMDNFQQIASSLGVAIILGVAGYTVITLYVSISGLFQLGIRATTFAVSAPVAFLSALVVLEIISTPSQFFFLFFALGVLFISSACFKKGRIIHHHRKHIDRTRDEEC